jgi:hypothetical protein
LEEQPNKEDPLHFALPERQNEEKKKKSARTGKEKKKVRK